MKTLMAAFVATAFLISAPAYADDKAPAADKADKTKSEKADKGSKKDKKDEKAGW